MLTEDKYCIDLSKEQVLLRDKDKSIDMIDVSLAGYRKLGFDLSNSKITKNWKVMKFFSIKCHNNK